MKDHIAALLDNLDHPERHPAPIGPHTLEVWFDTYGVDALRWALRQAEEVERLRDGIKVMIEGDFPRQVAEHYHDDASPSKLDICVHNRCLFDECENCLTDALQRLLDGE